MACHLNEIYLALDLESGSFLLPLEVFWCESLRSLTIFLYECKLELPSPYEILKLQIVSGAKKFKISSASLLEISVSNSGCSFDYLDITTQLLHTISLSLSATALLVNKLIVDVDSYDSDRVPPLRLLHTISLGVATSALSVNICAPYLFRVDCSGLFPEYFSMEIIKTEVKYFVSLRCNDTCSSATDDLQSLLYNIAPVTKLVIDSSAIQLLYDNKYLPCAFHNLESVVLSYNILTNITSPATVLFLHMLPHNLKKLHMDCVLSSGYYSMPTEIKHKLTEVASVKGGDLRSKGNMVVLELKPREQIMFYNKVYGNLSLMLVVVIVGSEHRLFDF
ncbi:hypothetical protein ACFE04_017421 [Oxalis oulophora]